MGISLGNSPGAGQSVLIVSHWSDSSRVLWTERCLVTLAAERHRMGDVWPGAVVGIPAGRSGSGWGVNVGVMRSGWSREVLRGRCG